MVLGIFIFFGHQLQTLSWEIAVKFYETVDARWQHRTHRDSKEWPWRASASARPWPPAPTRPSAPANNSGLDANCHAGGSNRLLQECNQHSRLVWSGNCCSTVVEHTPAEQNTLGHGFNSCLVLVFFLLFLFLSSASLIRSLKEVQHY